MLQSYREVVALRARHYGGMEAPIHPEQYATLVRNNPKAAASVTKEGSVVDAFFGRVHGPAYIGSQPIFKLKKVGSQMGSQTKSLLDPYSVGKVQLQSGR